MTTQPHPVGPAPDTPAPAPDVLRVDLVWNPPEPLSALLGQAERTPKEAHDDHS